MILIIILNETIETYLELRIIIIRVTMNFSNNLVHFASVLHFKFVKNDRHSYSTYEVQKHVQNLFSQITKNMETMR